MHKKRMKRIIQGIALGTIIVPVATVIYQLVAWFAYGFGESDLAFTEMLTYGAMNSVFGAIVALVVLVVYGLPVFLLLRHFSLANWLAVVVFTVTPWVIIDGFINKDIHHFIEFSWYSLASGFSFWLLARHSIAGETVNA
jgi:riboflavin transporter FmnP